VAAEWVVNSLAFTVSVRCSTGLRKALRRSTRIDEEAQQRYGCDGPWQPRGAGPEAQDLVHIGGAVFLFRPRPRCKCCGGGQATHWQAVCFPVV
jgi:hypothetical protein